MITESQWRSLGKLKKEQFQYPDMMEWETVQRLDYFAQMVNVTPDILSDYRPYDLGSWHSKGVAIDHFWPEIDPLFIAERLRSASLFSGIGIYLNDRGVVSFHTDNRPDRDPSNPAQWGQEILHLKDEQGNDVEVRGPYVAFAEVFEKVKAGASVTGFFFLGMMVFYLALKSAT